MIERLTSDSRRAAPGSAFFAWPGRAGDGRRHIGEAVARGCAAVLWEAGADEGGFRWNPDWPVPNVPVRNLRHEAGFLANAFHGRPSEAMWVCGVTGTNGKTSCAQWIAAFLSIHGARAGVLGTLGNGFPGALDTATHTTPDVLDLHRLLAELRSAGAEAIAMEVSSHGLDQERVNGVAFDCALFTNLTQDHLDYHGSMAAYAEAKTRLFTMPGLQAAVLNLDDALGVQLAQRLAGTGVRTLGYSLSGAAIGTAESLSGTLLPDGRLAIASPQGRAEVRLPQVGRFNAANALGVLGCLLARGLPFDAASRLLEQLPPVPGRMQRVGDRPLVIVDYAHTPDALDKVLHALRPVAQARGGKLWAVFGAGGGRDAAKRPAMGRAASRLADRVVLTSDNPRDEAPEAIIAAIRGGIEGACEIEPDRAAAIAAAIGAADASDVVLLAGKGHESTQEVAGERRPFSDAAVAAAALAKRRAP